MVFLQIDDPEKEKPEPNTEARDEVIDEIAEMEPPPPLTLKVRNNILRFNSIN